MIKQTKQKEAILRVLKGTTCHPAADWIYTEVRKEIPNISLGTVYRNLKLLQERKEILGLELSCTFSRFDGRRDNHYHFRCQKCDQVFDVDEPINKEMDERVAQETGFEVLCHQLEFRGLCKECQRD